MNMRAGDVLRALVPQKARRLLRRFFPAAPPIAPEYSDEYFLQVDAWQVASYPLMAQSIVTVFEPETIVDIGCGGGGLLSELKKLGIRCAGIEFSDAGRRLAQSRALDVRFGDLTRDCLVGDRYDLAICVEVAEHLPPEAADQLVANLSTGPDLLLFSAAPPGQGGHLHLNEQPNEYWLGKFARHGLACQEEETASLRRSWKNAGVVAWYADNIIVLRRSTPRP